jgi:ABC-type lipopolysaccharide export system ATPase subunit
MIALDVASRAYILATGKVTPADQASALLRNEQVRKTYLGEAVLAKGASPCPART